jgi:hypothetical protein
MILFYLFGTLLLRWSIDVVVVVVVEMDGGRWTAGRFVLGDASNRVSIYIQLLYPQHEKKGPTTHKPLLPSSYQLAGPPPTLRQLRTPRLAGIATVRR